MISLKQILIIFRNSRASKDFVLKEFSEWVQILMHTSNVEGTESIILVLIKCGGLYLFILSGILDKEVLWKSE